MKKTFTFQELVLILFTGAIVSCTLAGAASSVMKKDAVSICADNMRRLVHAYLPSHPHARSQESKIFGRVFLPLNASGRIFRL